jgi:NurA-like 5'-3' nuclease
MSKMGSDLSAELEKILEKTKDSNLLFYTLNKGERTCIFNFSMNSETHPILKEFEKMKNSFFSFYIKTVEFDRPLRVDFINFGNPIETANKLSGILMKTSGHAGYGMPAVLIEADQRAKLSEKDIDMFYSDLISRVGNVSSLFKMRREMRPF